LIFDSRNSTSALKVIEHDSISVNRDVYLLTGSLWNSGDYPISKEDVRVPISLTLSNRCRILDFKITKQKDPTIAGFVLLKEKPNSLNVGWNYFDPDFGFKFQIMYVGNNISDFKINGKILDIKEFNKIEKIEKRNGFLKWFNLLNPIVLLGFTIYGVIRYKGSTNRYDKYKYKYFLTLIILSIFLLSFYIWMYFINQTTAPI
jgi:hypothetical protein